MAKKSREITCAIFDYGKTLQDFHLDNYFGWASRITGLPRHFFWEAYSKYPDGIIHRVEVEPSVKRALELIREGIERVVQDAKSTRPYVQMKEFSDDELAEAWNSIIDLAPISRDRMELLRKLKGGGYKIYTLSNIDKVRLDYIKGDRRNGYRFTRFRDLFLTVNRFIASCDPDIRCRKIRPDGANQKECERIYQKAIKITGVSPEETVFIDDIPEYVEVFKHMGGTGIHCTGNWTKIEFEMSQLGMRFG